MDELYWYTCNLALASLSSFNFNCKLLSRFAYFNSTACRGTTHWRINSMDNQVLRQPLCPSKTTTSLSYNARHLEFFLYTYITSSFFVVSFNCWVFLNRFSLTFFASVSSCTNTFRSAFCVGNPKRTICFDPHLVLFRCEPISIRPLQ